MFFKKLLRNNNGTIHTCCLWHYFTLKSYFLPPFLVKRLRFFYFPLVPATVTNGNISKMSDLLSCTINNCFSNRPISYTTQLFESYTPELYNAVSIKFQISFCRYRSIRFLYFSLASVLVVLLDTWQRK